MSGMNKVINFRLKNRVSRRQALNWLISNYECYPMMQVGGIGDDVFHGWRFINVDGVDYFANCIDRGITEKEFIDFKYKDVRQITT